MHPEALVLIGLPEVFRLLSRSESCTIKGRRRGGMSGAKFVKYAPDQRKW